MSPPVSLTNPNPYRTMSRFSPSGTFQILPEMPLESIHVDPTDFGAFVIQSIARTSPNSPHLDQGVLRQCLGLSSSFMVTDATMNPEGGTATWFVGFSRLIDLLVALHARNELELETFNAASKACSECWGAAGMWRGLEDCRNGVRTVAEKLKDMLDANGRTYKGESVYAP